MTQPIRKRLKPDDRRAAILHEAAQILIEEGIGALTLRHAAKRLGIAPGLVNHYFPEIELLAAEAFAAIVEGEIAALFAPAGDPAARMARLIDALVQPERRAVSLLWLDAWQASRNREHLRAAVIAAMDLWQSALESLIAEGANAGQFACPDPAAAATRILALVDALSIQAVIDQPGNPAHATVRAMVLAGVERELGITL